MIRSVLKDKERSWDGTNLDDCQSERASTVCSGRGEEGTGGKMGAKRVNATLGITPTLTTVGV